jgi:4-amino-4-deoxy-L-arabinose transferase-like glycosyltransferase
MKLILKISKLDLVICILSMALYAAIANAPFKAKPFGDYDFHIEAKTIARVLWSQENYDAISITKAPGPVLFYIAPYFFAGPHATDDQYWLAGILWTGLFMTIAVLLIKASCKNFGSEKGGKIAVLLIFVLPLHVYYSLGILAEGLAFFGCCVMIYGYSKVYAKQGNSSWLTFGFGLLCLALARPNAVLVLPLLLVFVFWETIIRKNDFFRHAWKKFLIMWVMVVSILFSVTVVVKQLPNKRLTVKQEGYLGYVALIGRYQFRDETWDWRFWDDDIRPDSKDYQNWQNKMVELKSKIDMSSTDAYYDFLIHDMLDHPIVSVKQFLVRALFGHTLQVSSVKKESFGVGPLRGKGFYWFFHLSLNFFNLSLLVMSILFVIRKNDVDKYGILIMPWIALVVFHGIIYMEQRYLFPIRPVMIVLSSLFMAHYIPNRLTFEKFKWKT